MQPVIRVTGKDPEGLVADLEDLWRKGAIVGLTDPRQLQQLENSLGITVEGEALSRFGPGVVVGSGGSTGRRHWCLQPLANLEAAADATGRWLEIHGHDPAACVHLDPLPLEHVSGLMPMLRARRWGAALHLIPPALMKDPAQLSRCIPVTSDQPLLLSLVPIQLGRLMASPDGMALLARCSVIWVGGAALPLGLAAAGRRAGLALAPCYGATESAAMVSTLSPARFLAGEPGCGLPLDDVDLRIDPLTTAVEVRTDRLSPGWLEGGRLISLPLTEDGWWQSGDGGRITTAGLVVHGRIDGAINSGGETVFAEQVEERLRRCAVLEGLELAELLLVAVSDPTWGERLVGLFREEQTAGSIAAAPPEAKTERMQGQLHALAGHLPPSQRPLRWQHCPDLERDSIGKWNREYWKKWFLGLSLPN